MQGTVVGQIAAVHPSLIELAFDLVQLAWLPAEYLRGIGKPVSLLIEKLIVGGLEQAFYLRVCVQPAHIDTSY